MTNNDDRQPKLRGYVTGYASKPEYTSIAYGKLTIPFDVIQAAVDAGNTKVVKDRECVILDFTLYDYDGTFENPRPTFQGEVVVPKPKSDR